MTMSFGPNLGLLVDGAIGEQHFANLMAQFRGIDGLVQCHVKDKDLATPPASPVNGDMYIVAASPTGTWVGHAGKLAYYYVIPANGSNGATGTAGWQFFTPRKGWRTHVEDENVDYQYNGSGWVITGIATGGGGGGSSNTTQTVASSAGVLDLSTTTSSIILVTLTENITSVVMPTGVLGQSVERRIMFTQGGSGNYTVSGWTGVSVEGGGSVPPAVTGTGSVTAYVLANDNNTGWRMFIDDSLLRGGTLSGALNEAPPVTLASAATVNIGAAAANTINITGTTTITAFDAIAAGARRTTIFAGALTLTHNAASMILPGGANIVTAAGDVAEWESLGGGNWKCLDYTRAVNAPIVFGTAATRNVQTSANDTTAGALMAVGAFGLGNNGTPPIVVDANDAVLAGLYRVDSPYTNCPIAQATTILVMRYQATVVQIAFQMGGSSAGNRMFYRMYDGTSTWGPWARLWTNTGANEVIIDTGTIGYGTGSGGTVTQATNKSTAVTLNKPSGQITLNAASLAAGTAVSFTLTNNRIAANDMLRVQIKSGATAGGSYLVQCDQVSAGSCRISVRNLTGGARAEALVLQFDIAKGAIA